MIGLRQARDAARMIAGAVLGRDPGPMAKEVRDAAHLASDLRIALERPDAHARMAADRLRGLEELVVGRYWWRRTR
jgi:hypothetical protein